jgi:predicted nucleic acid-binding protein
VDAVTDYVLDTMALVRYLEDDLPATADRAFQEAEEGKGRLLLPEIALSEFVYIALKGRIRAADPRALVEEVMDQIRAARHIEVSCLSEAAWEAFLDLEIPELHDRMIAADAVAREVPLITHDPSFSRISKLEVVWD